MKEWEISQIDLKYALYRLRDAKREQELLASIAERGIQDALVGIENDRDGLILIDGFKRIRCAQKLRISVVYVKSLGKGEAAGLIQFLREMQNRNLTFIEEAKLIDALNKEYRMSVVDIAQALNKSPAWVSLRLGVMSEIPGAILDEIISGRFPYRAYLYTIRPFTRVKENLKNEIEGFVQRVSGKGLSVQKIQTLARAYFEGDKNFKEQVLKGDLEWTLEQLKERYPRDLDGFNDQERNMLEALQRVDGLMKRIAYDLTDKRLDGRSFLTQANLWIGIILKEVQPFIKNLQEFYDQQRKADSC